MQAPRSFLANPLVVGASRAVLILTILIVFLIDHVDGDLASRDIVGERLGSSVKTVGDEVRHEVHEATVPDTSIPPRRHRLPTTDREIFVRGLTT